MVFLLATCFHLSCSSFNWKGTENYCWWALEKNFLIYLKSKLWSKSCPVLFLFLLLWLKLSIYYRKWTVACWSQNNNHDSQTKSAKPKTLVKSTLEYWVQRALGVGEKQVFLSFSRFNFRKSMATLQKLSLPELL